MEDDLYAHEIKLGPKEKYSVLVIYKKELLLLRKTDEQKWELPGGEAEGTETPDEASKRELNEETKIPTDKIIFKETHKVETELSHRKRVDIAYVLNLAEKPTIALSEEHEEYRWATIEKALKMKLRKRTRRILSDPNLLV